MNIHNVRIYSIQIYGHVKEEDINRSSPLQFKIEQDGEDNTFVAARSDQSGLIGLIRHLHGLGLVLVSMSSHNEDPFDPCSEAPGNGG